MSTLQQGQAFCSHRDCPQESRGPPSPTKGAGRTDFTVGGRISITYCISCWDSSAPYCNANENWPCKPTPSLSLSCAGQDPCSPSPSPSPHTHFPAPFASRSSFSPHTHSNRGPMEITFNASLPSPLCGPVSLHARPKEGVSTHHGMRGERERSEEKKEWTVDRVTLVGVPSLTLSCQKNVLGWVFWGRTRDSSTPGRTTTPTMCIQIVHPSQGDPQQGTKIHLRERLAKRSPTCQYHHPHHYQYHTHRTFRYRTYTSLKKALMVSPSILALCSNRNLAREGGIQTCSHKGCKLHSGCHATAGQECRSRNASHI